MDLCCVEGRKKAATFSPCSVCAAERAALLLIFCVARAQRVPGYHASDARVPVPVRCRATVQESQGVQEKMEVTAENFVFPLQHVSQMQPRTAGGKAAAVSCLAKHRQGAPGVDICAERKKP